MVKELEMTYKDRILALNILADPNKAAEGANVGKDRTRTISKMAKTLKKDMPLYFLENVPYLTPEEQQELSSSQGTSQESQLKEKYQKLIVQRQKEREEVSKTKSKVRLEDFAFSILKKMAEDGVNWNYNKGWNNPESADDLFDLLDNAIDPDKPKEEMKVKESG